MRVAHNIVALGAWRQLSQVGDRLGKSVQRISSGYRINAASDDPAGLVISENLRAQVRGMEQAVSNTQEGMSMIQTAEGALSEIHSLLSSMRSLALHAANTAALTVTGLAADQEQLDSAINSVQRIATTTAYAGKMLIDGTLGYTLEGMVKDEVNVAAIDVGDANINQALAGTTFIDVEITQKADKAHLGWTEGGHFTSSQMTIAAATSGVSSGDSIDLNIDGVTVEILGSDTAEEAIVKINEALGNAGKEIEASLRGYGITGTVMTSGSIDSIDTTDVKLPIDGDTAITIVITTVATQVALGVGVGATGASGAALSAVIGVNSGASAVLTIDGDQILGVTGGMTIREAVDYINVELSGDTTVKITGTDIVAVSDWGDEVNITVDTDGLILTAADTDSDEGIDVGGYFTYLDEDGSTVTGAASGDGLTLSANVVSTDTSRLDDLAVVMKSGVSEYGVGTYADALTLTVNDDTASGYLYLEHDDFGDYTMDLRDTSNVFIDNADGTAEDQGRDISGYFVYDNDLGGVTGSAAATGNGLYLVGNEGTYLDGLDVQMLAAGNTADTYASALRIVLAGGQITFQVGANMGETYETSISSMKSQDLGNIAGTNTEGLEALKALGTYALDTDAQTAISIIDQAIEDVSTERAKLGSVQANVLESNVRNLGIAKENLEASESRIRDVDMAREMMEFTKNQVLTQAATAMLAQANALPQMVLTLLR